ncbi:glycosyltransferase [Paenibacillus chartarius]|uniref:Glycosyltransferase n=1 Tax=Paenibacillus chartarius TaxID=747481 RepID=A0ABV6DJW5_9BACL
MITSIVIATFNKLEYTQQCIESIRRYTEYGTYEIIVVDNNSQDGTRAWLAQQNDIRTIYNDRNFGFPKACNQGIEIAKGDILLLNNDTVVTTNWLVNMRTALYSSENIGAVGTVTNNCSYYQAIAVNYSTIDEMQKFAAEFNHSDPRKWEERLKLIGYNMLIKASVVKEIGLLDELFSPGNFEDDDYGVRIRLAGYKLILCKDTFIHHIGSASWREDMGKFNALLVENQQKFITKWGYDSDTAYRIRLDPVQVIDFPYDKPIRILEIGCKAGGTLLLLKHTYPEAELHGIETDEILAGLAAMVGRVTSGELKAAIEAYPDHYFDVILAPADVKASSISLLDAVKRKLSPNGQLIAEFPNAAHYSVFKQLLKGVVPAERTERFTLEEVQQYIQPLQFRDVQFYEGSDVVLLEEDKALISSLVQLTHPSRARLLEVSRFLVAASDRDPIVYALEQLLSQINVDKNVEKLQKFQADQVIEAISSRFPAHETIVLNVLAVLLMDRKQVEQAMPYLQKAFELDGSNPQTLLNLGVSTYRLGQAELALEWLSLIPEKDAAMLRWIESIEKEIEIATIDKYMVKNLLRRIEQNVEREASIQTLAQYLLNELTTLDKIMQVAQNDLIHPVDTLNLLMERVQLLESQ